jgi:hypothetical protein
LAPEREVPPPCANVRHSAPPCANVRHRALPCAIVPRRAPCESLGGRCRSPHRCPIAPLLARATDPGPSPERVSAFPSSGEGPGSVAWHRTRACLSRRRNCNRRPAMSCCSPSRPRRRTRLRFAP